MAIKKRLSTPVDSMIPTKGDRGRKNQSRPGFRLGRRRLQQELLEDRVLLFAAGIHQAITAESLGFLDSAVLQQIKTANAQQLESPHSAARNRFEDSDFRATVDQINSYYDQLLEHVSPANPNWSIVAEKFGRIVHSAQSFYAYTNWIDILDYCGTVQTTCSVPAGGQLSIAEQSLGFWDNFSPYSKIANSPVANAVIVQGEDLTPRTPYGVGALSKLSHGISIEGKAYDAQVVLVTTPASGNPSSTQSFVGLTSGVRWWRPDDAPDSVSIDVDSLYKGSDGHARFEGAKSLAAAQTRHELARLINLVKDRYGTAAHLTDRWLKTGQESEASLAAYNQLMLSKQSAASLTALRSAAELSAIRHVTVITHGFQLGNRDGDSLLAMAQALHHRTGGWFVDYDVPEEGKLGRFQVRRLPNLLPNPATNGEHLVVLFDWAAESNELSKGWTQAAGDALFTMLVDLDVINPHAGTGPAGSLHFIAHSFGSSVNSHAIERLSAYNVPVTQATYLDPHDFSQGGLIWDDAQGQYLTGLPQPGSSSEAQKRNYGVTNWENVAFTDVYFQTRNHGGLVDQVVPGGRPIPGAHNRWLSTQDGLPLAGTYSLGYVGGDHSYVWDYWYSSSIIGVEATDNLPRPAVIGSSVQSFSQYFAGQGFNNAPLGRLVASQPLSSYAQSARNFYNLPNGNSGSAEQPHRFSSPLIVNTATGQPLPASAMPEGLLANKIQFGSWPSRLPASLPLVNGDFENRGDTANWFLTNNNIIPGWSHHGGGGQGTIALVNGNQVLRLNQTGRSRSHNAFFLDLQQGVIEFHLRITTASSNDRLKVLIGSDQIASIPLGPTGGSSRQRIAIPESLRSKVQTLTFRLDSQVGSSVQAVVEIDDVELRTYPKTAARLRV